VDAGDDHTDDRDAVDESDDAGAEDDHTDDADADDESDDAGLDIDDVDADDDSDDADAEDEDVSDGPEINPEDRRPFSRTAPTASVDGDRGRTSFPGPPGVRHRRNR
jgi:hypothetical protein